MFSSASRRGTAIAAAALSLSLVAPSVSAAEVTPAPSGTVNVSTDSAKKATSGNLSEKETKEIVESIAVILAGGKREIPLKQGTRVEVNLSTFSKLVAIKAPENSFVTIDNGVLKIDVPQDAKVGEKTTVNATVPGRVFNVKRPFTFVVTESGAKPATTTPATTTQTSTTESTTSTTPTSEAATPSSEPTSTTPTSEASTTSTTPTSESNTSKAPTATTTTRPELSDKCKSALIGFGIPLAALIPLGLLAQVGLGGANTVANSVNQWIRDFNAEIQRQAGVLNPELARQVEAADKALRAFGWSVGSAAIGLTTLAGGIAASAVILDACIEDGATIGFGIENSSNPFKKPTATVTTTETSKESPSSSATTPSASASSQSSSSATSSSQSSSSASSSSSETAPAATETSTSKSAEPTPAQTPAPAPAPAA